MQRKNLFLTVFASIVFWAAPLSFAFAATLGFQSLTPGSNVPVGTEASFTILPSGFVNPVTYTVSDSFSGTSLTSSDINSAGVFAWIPTQSDAGIHTLTITGNDGTYSATVSLTLTVNGSPTVTIQSLSPSTVVSPNTTVTFTAVPTSFTSTPSFTLGDTFTNSSLSSGNINTSGQFSWTPTVNDVGTHVITVQVTDPSRDAANVTETITVQGTGSLSVSPASPASTIPAGTNVTFSALPSGFSPTSYMVTDTFPNSSVSNNNVSASGYFTWTPTANDVGTHTITLTGTGNGVNESAAITISVTGTTVVPTTVAPIPTVSAVPAYVFNVYLKPGSEGADVSELQRILIKDGYLTAASNGYFGAQTEAAVEAYQKAHNLAQLGVVGPGTRAALNAEESTSTTFSTSNRAAAIALIEQELQQIEAQIAALEALPQ